MLQFGIRICSIKVSKEKVTHLYFMPCLQWNFRRKSIQDRLLSQEQSNSVHFPENIDVSAAFPSRRAFRNSSEGLEEMLLDGVAYKSVMIDESAIVVFSTFLLVWPSSLQRYCGSTKGNSLSALMNIIIAIIITMNLIINIIIITHIWRIICTIIH